MVHGYVLLLLISMRIVRRDMVVQVIKQRRKLSIQGRWVRVTRMMLKKKSPLCRSKFKKSTMKFLLRRKGQQGRKVSKSQGRKSNLWNLQLQEWGDWERK